MNERTMEAEFLADGLTELISLLEWYQKSIPDGHSQENYLVQIESTRKLVATRLAEVLRNEKKELISQKDSELTALRKANPTETDRLTSYVLGENTTASRFGSTLRSNQSPSHPDLFIAQ